MQWKGRYARPNTRVRAHTHNVHKHIYPNTVHVGQGFEDTVLWYCRVRVECRTWAWYQPLWALHESCALHNIERERERRYNWDQPIHQSHLILCGNISKIHLLIPTRIHLFNMKKNSINASKTTQNVKPARPFIYSASECTSSLWQGHLAHFTT